MTQLSNPVWIRIIMEHDIFRAMLEAENLATSIGFHPSMVIRIKTSVSELGRNILKYAVKGKIIITPISKNNKKGIQVEVSDKGPGIEDVEKALSDSYSTGGTLGLGLPGVKRMMDEFEIDSTPGEGTRITIRKWM